MYKNLNMSVKNLLLWEKWRPKKLEDIILLPRIKKQFENGINQHYIFYGHYGTGKTSLARILIGKYSKETPFLELNCSLDTSIDVLREEIQNFCKFTPMFESNSDIKYVFLDEFERVSAQFQDAFKAFIEKYNNSVRFIITTNHINKISDGLKSRIKTVNFDCVDVEEEKHLKIELYKRIQNTILPKEEREISKDNLVSIISKKFPDFRSILVEVQDFLETGDINNGVSNVSNKVKKDLFNFLYENGDYESVYHFLMSNFGQEKIDSMIKLLGKPFIDWSIENSKNIDKLFECNYVIADYTNKLETNTDPIVLGMTIIGKLRDILKEN
jgi:DNA polymerase III delta prime subunit